MNIQDYEQKKQECWEEFKNAAFNGDTTYSIYSAFNFAFDRAYALGKVKDLISQDEIDKAAEDYVSFEKGGKCYPSYIVERACCSAFKDGANFALGKQEKDADTVISGWMARDKDNNLFIYSDKPKRVYDGEFSRWEGLCLDTISNNLFPDLTWDDDPIKVELIIKRKKNG